jgi:N-acetyl-gamma-glutamyl-phosphate reductase
MGDVGRIPVGIVGASGYGGVQLVRLLMDHPRLELAYLGGESSAGSRLQTFIHTWDIAFSRL